MQRFKIEKNWLIIIQNWFSQVKGLDIPVLDAYPQSKPVISDTSLEDANRIIFSPWEAISGYEETVTDNVIDIPGNIAGIGGIPDGDSNQKNKDETTLPPGLEQIANKLNISTEDEKSNKSSAFSQLVIRVQSVHFRKVSIYVFFNFTITFYKYIIYFSGKKKFLFSVEIKKCTKS